MVKEKNSPVERRQERFVHGHELVLHNDDIHSFDFVIETLVEVCEHEHLQAEQCAFIAHHNGKCPVKSGQISDLKPRFDEMTRRGLIVTIETA